VRKADNLPPFCAVVMKSGKLNLLEHSGSLQACNGTDLFFLTFSVSAPVSEFIMPAVMILMLYFLCGLA